MSWVAVGSAVVGGVASYAGQRGAKKVNPDQFNAYGEQNAPMTGAVESRNRIFDTINSEGFRGGVEGANADYVSFLRGAADNPNLNAIQDYASRSMRGDFLQNPIITGYADRAAAGINAGGADASSRLASLYARAGQGFSTGQIQAMQGGRTAAAAEAERTRAGILAQNLQSERALQQTAPALLQGVDQQRAGYLGSAAGAMYQPYQLQAGLTTSLLAGGNQIVRPEMQQQPGFSDYLAKGVGTAQSLFDLYKTYSGKN